MTIEYVIGDATDPPRDYPGVIVHVCNDVGAWGKGFVLAISRRWKQPEEQFRAWANGDQSDQALRYELGQVQIVPVEENLWVANVIGQQGIRRKDGTPPVRYQAIEQGLRRAAKFVRDKRATVHMPRIACGLAGGTWDKVEPIILQELVLQGIPVRVYDMPA